MPSRKHPSRAYVMALVRRGEVVSAAEIGIIAGVPRQTAYRWLREEHSDLRARRLDWLAKHHARAETSAEGRLSRRPSKAELRRQTERMVRDFNRANGRPLA